MSTHHYFDVNAPNVLLNSKWTHKIRLITCLPHTLNQHSPFQIVDLISLRLVMAQGRNTEVALNYFISVSLPYSTIHHQLLSVILPINNSNLSYYPNSRYYHPHWGFCQSLLINLSALPTYKPFPQLQAKQFQYKSDYITLLLKIVQQAYTSFRKQSKLFIAVCMAYMIRTLPICLRSSCPTPSSAPVTQAFVKFFKHTELVSKSGLLYPSFSPKILIWLNHHQWWSKVTSSENSSSTVPSNIGQPSLTVLYIVLIFFSALKFFEII